MPKRTATGLAFVALIIGAVVALPAVTHAGLRADYEQTFSTPIPGVSAGSDTRILFKHPDDPEAKPIPVRREVFTFPRGTTFDGSVVPDCTASDLELQLFGEAACPPESRIGAGTDEGTVMTGFPGQAETPSELDVFDAESGFRVLGGAKGFPLRFVAHGHREGRVITVDAPRTPGGPPDGETALRRVHNIIDARSLGDRAYMRTPSRCPRSGVWTFRVSFTFADGAVEDAVHRMPCSRS